MIIMRNDIEFNKNQTNHLKGIFAIGVVVCHLCSKTGLTSSIGLGPIYTALGYWSVSVFMFISGYGLIAQYQRFGGGIYGILSQNEYFRCML